MAVCPNCGHHWWACHCTRRQREEAWENPYSYARTDPVYDREEAERFEEELRREREALLRGVRPW